MSVPVFEVGDIVLFDGWLKSPILEINESHTRFKLQERYSNQEVYDYFWTKEENFKLIRKVTPLEKAML